jgi:hypothetical protein
MCSRLAIQIRVKKSHETVPSNKDEMTRITVFKDSTWVSQLLMVEDVVSNRNS